MRLWLEKGTPDHPIDMLHLISLYLGAFFAVAIGSFFIAPSFHLNLDWCIFTAIVAAFAITATLWIVPIVREIAYAVRYGRISTAYVRSCGTTVQVTYVLAVAVPLLALIAPLVGHAKVLGDTVIWHGQPTFSSLGVLTIAALALVVGIEIRYGSPTGVPILHRRWYPQPGPRGRETADGHIAIENTPFGPGSFGPSPSNGPFLPGTDDRRALPNNGNAVNGHHQPCQCELCVPPSSVGCECPLCMHVPNHAPTCSCATCSNAPDDAPTTPALPPDDPGTLPLTARRLTPPPA